MERFAEIHYDPEKTEEESFQDFIQCLEDHRIIMDIFKIIENNLSFTIFFQFIASILAFSTSGVIYLRFSPTLAETTAIFILMLAEITEVFPSCYYSNKFMEKTDQMVFMLYSSNWMDLSPRFRKHLIIFMQMTQEKKVILAGKQIPITLATFMSTAFQQQLSLEQVPNDFLGALYLSVLGAHLEIIMERFADIHYDPEKTEEESFQDFIKCIDDHQIIINIFETIQNTLSITIFIQCITSILAFSTAGLIYLRFSPSFTETVAAFVFMVAEVTEIFPSCYYSDKFMEKTDRIVFMLYSSNWMDLSPRFRKHLIIFMQMTQKKKVILAGKQIPITLATFMSLLENVPMNICLIACTIKFFVILRLRPSLIEINKQLKRLDNRPMTDKQKDKLRRVINFCRLISLGVILFYLGVNLTYALAGALSNGTKLGFDSWFPYDWKKNAFRFWITLFIQTMFQLILSVQNVANDFTGALYLCLLSAHLQIIMERFANIHHDPEKTEEESFQDFVDCLEDHRIIMDIFKIIENTISFTIFFQFIASIIVFSTSGLIYLRFSPSLTETAAIFVFMIAEITEIYPSCYYSNKFMEKTDQMVFMLYSSNWMDLSPRFRKHLIIFMQMTQEKKIILAGKQIPITLATFMTVMKAMYTVLMIMKPSE
ncbi:unnamed protein product [Hermetia illucens]|uniref:Odorant receptor n=1 Tax=Hermetia illucens TaxID=343691 RepID=A0A7R8YW40_HERIL|nr:unnamed protein product [Hermetia illucens]